MLSLTRLVVLVFIFFGSINVAEAKSRYTNARSCLSSRAAEALERLEQAIGRVQVISTCRPGARVKGTKRLSRHSSGDAIDFRARNKREAVRWLIANHKGGIMTYRRSSHIHMDVGPRFVKLAAR